MAYITTSYLRESGILQELNRRFLHPLGMAAEVAIGDDPDTEVAILKIQSDPDPEGWIFGAGVAGDDKRERFQKLESEWHARRLQALGFIVQP